MEDNIALYDEKFAQFQSQYAQKVNVNRMGFFPHFFSQDPGPEENEFLNFFNTIRKMSERNPIIDVQAKESTSPNAEKVEVTQVCREDSYEKIRFI